MQPTPGGRHAQCRGKTARMAAVYHFKLCRAIPVGFRSQLRKDGVCKDGVVGMLRSGMEGQEVPAVLPCFHLTNDKGSILKVQVEGDEIFRDDLTGQLLDPELVGAAKKKELEYFDGKDVWVLRPMDECRRVTGKAQQGR